MLSNRTRLESWFVEEIANRIDPGDSFVDDAGDEEIVYPDICDWAEANFIDPVTEKRIKLEEHQKRLHRRIFQRIFDHEVTTVVWSEIKKSGKTTQAAMVGTYWATFVEPKHNEIISVANDQEQATGRIFGAMKPTLAKLGWDVPESRPEIKNVYTGTVVKAISTNYAGEAGGNQGLTLWSELWAYTSEARRRLWAEMTQVPTRKYSIRWVETYAGYLNESDLLWELYVLLFPKGPNESYINPDAVREFDDLPAWYIPSQKLFIYWSHDPRMPWQTPEFIEQQRRTPGMRPNEHNRLWRNVWVANEDIFIDIAEWDACTDGTLIPLQPEDDRQVVIACDGSTSRDCTALVVATWDADKSIASILYVRVWTPQQTSLFEKKIVDLDESLKKEIEHLIDDWRLNIVGVVYDPYQLHSVMTDLRKKYDKTGTRKLFDEFPQTNKRVESDMAFFDYINQHRLRHLGDSTLREHVQNAVARSTERGFRLDKDATKKKIDGAVAASMACYEASLRVKKPRKFVHV